MRLLEELIGGGFVTVAIYLGITAIFKRLYRAATPRTKKEK